jgi:hypothetical protein
MNYLRPMFLILIGIMYCQMTTMLICLFQSFHSEILKVVDRHAPVTRISRNEVKTVDYFWY